MARRSIRNTVGKVKGTIFPQGGRPLSRETQADAKYIETVLESNGGWLCLKVHRDGSWELTGGQSGSSAKEEFATGKLESGAAAYGSTDEEGVSVPLGGMIEQKVRVRTRNGGARIETQKVAKPEHQKPDPVRDRLRNASWGPSSTST